MSKLRKAAKGQECQVQLYPYCNMNSETTVLAHAPSEDKGWGIKTQDWFGSFCCSTCHDIVDGRRHVPDISNDEIYRCHIRGVHRTIKIFIEMGLINVSL